MERFSYERHRSCASPSRVRSASIQPVRISLDTGFLFSTATSCITSSPQNAFGELKAPRSRRGYAANCIWVSENASSRQFVHKDNLLHKKWMRFGCNPLTSPLHQVIVQDERA